MVSVERQFHETQLPATKTSDFPGVFAAVDIETGAVDDFKSVSMKKKHGIQTGSTPTISVGENLLKNHSFEFDTTGTGWPDAWDKSGTATFEWSTTVLVGSRSVRIADATGEAAVGNTQTVAYDASKTFTASAFVKTSGLSVPAAFVKLVFYDANGNQLPGGTIKSRRLGGTNDWTRLTVTATPADAPANAAKVRAWVGIEQATGSAYFDAVQLEQGSVTSATGGATNILSAYNLVEDQFRTLGRLSLDRVESGHRGRRGQHDRLEWRQLLQNQRGR